MKKVIVNYEDFVLGLSQRTIKFEVDRFKKIPKEADGYGVGKLIVVITLLNFLPIIYIPIICYIFNKWILLFGFLGILMGLMVAGINSKSSNPFKYFIQSLFPFALIPVVLLIYVGLANVFCFISICFYYQFFFMTFGDIIHDFFYKKYLIKSPKNYYDAIESNAIITYRI